VPSWAASRPLRLEQRPRSLAIIERVPNGSDPSNDWRTHRCTPEVIPKTVRDHLARPGRSLKELLRHTHPYGADHYEIPTVVRSPSEIEERWRVRGPTEDYDAVATLRRFD
jgi:hypothetical protein